MTSSTVRPVVAITASAALFAVANVAWRYGDGGSFELAAQRALVGAIFFAPFTWAAWRNGGFATMIKDRAAVIGIVLSGATMPASALMFRTLTGPEAGLRLAIAPAILILITRKRAGFGAVIVCIAAAAGSVLAGGLGPLSFSQLAPAALNLVLDIGSIVALEKARTRHSASALVGSAMVFATIGCSLVALVSGHTDIPPTSGVVAATVVGVCGTAARSLRAQALPQLGSTVSFSSTQITALLTAIAGVLIFADPLDWLSGFLGLVSAAAAMVAALQAAAVEAKHAAAVAKQAGNESGVADVGSDVTARR